MYKRFAKGAKAGGRATSGDDLEKVQQVTRWVWTLSRVDGNTEGP